MTGNGTVIALIGAGVAHDAAGNANTASTSADNSVTFVGTLPLALHFVVGAPPGATAATPFTFTVTVRDQLNNTVTGYNGTVHFTSSDRTAALPPDSTLVNGVGTFTATLRATGNQTLTATDTVAGSLAGS